VLLHLLFSDSLYISQSPPPPHPFLSNYSIHTRLLACVVYSPEVLLSALRPPLPHPSPTQPPSIPPPPVSFYVLPKHEPLAPSPSPLDPPLLPLIPVLLLLLINLSPPLSTVPFPTSPLPPSTPLPSHAPVLFFLSVFL
jgi:hypothetical protein